MKSYPSHGRIQCRSVPFDVLVEARGLLTLGVLLLLPGLLVVRAPWTAVPFLSAAFWIVSWWWLPRGIGPLSPQSTQR